jgi:hypothetical protein
MGLDTVEKTASSTRLRYSPASWRSISETDDRDPVVMQAIATVTGGWACADWWLLGQKEITQAHQTAAPWSRLVERTGMRCNIASVAFAWRQIGRSLGRVGCLGWVTGDRTG